MQNTSKWLDIPTKEIESYVGPERDRFLLKKLKEAGFDINKHIATKRKKGVTRFIQNRVVGE